MLIDNIIIHIYNKMKDKIHPYCRGFLLLSLKMFAVLICPLKISSALYVSLTPFLFVSPSRFSPLVSFQEIIANISER